MTGAPSLRVLQGWGFPDPLSPQSSMYLNLNPHPLKFTKGAAPADETAKASLRSSPRLSLNSYGWNCLPLITIFILGAVGLELPRNPTGLPFLAGMALISTSSPGLKVFLLQPICSMDTGFCASTIQCTMLPPASLTSTFT